MSEQATQVVPAIETPVTPVVPAPAPAAAQPTVEQLQEALEASEALRADSDKRAQDATRDLIAVKTGKKRADVSLEAPAASAPAPVPAPAPAQPDLATIAAQLAESNRINAELLRSQRPGQAMPTGGGGFAPSPAPKPTGYWSEAQKAHLKATKGWSDAQIARAENVARTGSHYGTKTPEEYGLSAKRPY